MGGALFEGWVVSETVKAFASLGKKADIYYWRSHDGLEVDLLIQIGTKIHPVEIKFRIFILKRWVILFLS